MKRQQTQDYYYKEKDSEGNVCGYIVIIDGQLIPVEKEIYQVIAKSDRKERYLLRDQKRGRCISLNCLEQDEVRESYVGAPASPSCLEILLTREDEAEPDSREALLLPAILSLSEKDRELIVALFFDNMTTHAAAEKFGVSQHRIREWRDRALCDLKKYYQCASLTI